MSSSSPQVNNKKRGRVGSSNEHSPDNHPDNHRKVWSPSESQALWDGVVDGKTLQEMAGELQRGFTAVQYQLSKLAAQRIDEEIDSEEARKIEEARILDLLQSSKINADDIGAARARERKRKEDAARAAANRAAKKEEEAARKAEEEHDEPGPGGEKPPKRPAQPQYRMLEILVKSRFDRLESMLTEFSERLDTFDDRFDNIDAKLDEDDE